MKRALIVGLIPAVVLSSAAISAPIRPRNAVPHQQAACGGGGGAAAVGGKPCLFPLQGQVPPQTLASNDQTGPTTPRKRRFFGLPLLPLFAALAGGGAALAAGGGGGGGGVSPQ